MVPSCLILLAASLVCGAAGLKLSGGSENEPPQSPAEPPLPLKVMKVLEREPLRVGLNNQSSRMDKTQCEMISSQLASSGNKLASEIFAMSCKRERSCRIELPDLSDGCLVMSSDNQLITMLAEIGRPNPCAFTEMVMNSFLDKSQCAHLDSKADLDPRHSVAKGGVVYEPCMNDQGSGGFRSGQSCVSAKYLGTTSSVSVYVAPGLMGLPAAWQKMVQQSLLRKPAAAPTFRDNSSSALGPIKVKFYACREPNAKSQFDKTRVAKMCKKQIEVMNTAFSGRSGCSGYTAYNIEFADPEVTFAPFEDEDLSEITDSLCAMADYNYEEIWAKYMPAERGLHKVLLGDGATSSILGVSAFPTDHVRGTMIGLDTMPGGSMEKYNLGNTLVHETGHFLGLYHTFQDGCYGNNDGFDDTPAEMQPYFGCPTKGLSKPLGCKAGEVAPVHNFMDYEDDKCMCHFTNEQVSKMKSNIPLYIM